MNTTATPVETHVLTTQDIRALKHADSICFDHTREGFGQIRAIVRAENSSTGFEQTHTIRAFVSSLDRYGPDRLENGWTAFHMESSAKYSPVAQTLIRHMRAGGQFTLNWVRDNNNDILRDAGLHQDELRMRIAPPNGKHVDVFLVRVSVGYDNTARMIRGL